MIPIGSMWSTVRLAMTNFSNSANRAGLAKRPRYISILGEPNGTELPCGESEMLDYEKDRTVSSRKGKIGATTLVRSSRLDDDFLNVRCSGFRYDNCADRSPTPSQSADDVDCRCHLVVLPLGKSAR